MKISIKGMHCESCAKRVELELRELTGIKNVKVNLSAETCDIDFDEEKVSLSEIKKEINKLGYKSE